MKAVFSNRKSTNVHILSLQAHINGVSLPCTVFVASHAVTSFLEVVLKARVDYIITIKESSHNYQVFRTNKVQLGIEISLPFLVHVFDG